MKEIKIVNKLSGTFMNALLDKGYKNLESKVKARLYGNFKELGDIINKNIR